MAGQTDANITLPADNTNAGKKLRTRKQTISGEEVHQNVVIPARSEKVTGVYRSGSATLSVAASAQNGTTTGFLWLFVDSAATKAARIRKIDLVVSITGSTAMPTAPRVVAQRFTWTASPTGAGQQSQPLDTTYPNPVLDIRTASSGWTVTLVSGLLGVTVVPSTHTVGTAASFTAVPNYQDDLIKGEDEDEWIVIRPGQGLVIYQPDAATATDLRRIAANLLWDEVELAS